MQERANLGNRAHGPLAQLRVLELGQGIAAPFAGKVLADLGAAVTKIEWPEIDPARQAGPFPPGAEGDPDRSATFLYLNSAKSTLNFTGQPTGDLAASVRDRLPDTDVILLDEHANWGGAGLAPSDLCRSNPRLVVATISPYGFDGPYRQRRAYDSTISAAGGLSFGIGEPGRPPLPMPMSQSSYQAGLCCIIGILLALAARERDGLGQHVDISAHEVIASLHCGYFLPRFLYGGGVVGSRSARVGGTQPYPNTVLRCADGLVVLSAPQIGQWLRFLELMGLPSWADLPRYRKRRAMQHEYKAEVDALIEPWLERHTKADLLSMFVEHRIPFAPLLTGEDICTNRHLLARRSLELLRFPDGTEFLVPASPLRFRWQPDEGTRPPARDRLAGRIKDGADTPAAPAISGLTVLDLGTAWAGGIAGRILGDFGADVIKVESWSHMDGSRMGRPIVVDDAEAGDSGRWPDLQPGFHVHGRNKKSVALDLKNQAGRDLLRELAAQADVLIHNYPPATAARLGITESGLRPHNEDLLIVGQSVAGAGGPYSELIGYAGTVAALSGLAHAVGYPGEEPIGMMEGLYCDVVSALTTVVAVLAGLVGILRGAVTPGSADIAQWDATLALCAETVMKWSIRHEDNDSIGYSSPVLAPQGAYLGSEEQWVCLAVGSDQEWQHLAGLLGEFRPAPDCGEWDLDTRIRHEGEINSCLAAWTQASGTPGVLAALWERGLAASAVGSIADVFTDEQLMYRAAFVDVDHPLVGIEPMPGIPIKLSRTPGQIRRPAPLLGEHTFEVLRTYLHLDDDQIQRLVRDGAVETQPTRTLTKTSGEPKGHAR